MCGIAGYIGKSKKPKSSYQLITALFDYLELRGVDASGIWGTVRGKNKGVVYHKEPVKSSLFVKRQFWKDIEKINPDLLLVHSRYTSQGNGDANKNKNNHPFASADKRIGMVHNGTIDEARFLRDKYEISSDTDSEVLLRMYEAGLEEKPPISYRTEADQRLQGISDIWSLVSQGAMAVAIGERIDDYKRCLFLFHNDQRPLWMADLRDSLGQIFFFSSPDIWLRAYAGNPSLKSIILSTELIEIPTNQIWFFMIDKKNPHVIDANYIRFDVELSGTETWESSGYVKIADKKVELPVITEMDEDENVTIEESEFIEDDHREAIYAIEGALDRLVISLNNQFDHNLMTQEKYDASMECMEQAKEQLEEALKSLNWEAI
jgi:predicted glutamine amidotransferase